MTKSEKDRKDFTNFQHSLSVSGNVHTLYMCSYRIYLPLNICYTIYILYVLVYLFSEDLLNYSSDLMTDCCFSLFGCLVFALVCFLSFVFVWCCLSPYAVV